MRTSKGVFSGEKLYAIVIEQNPTTTTDNTLSDQIKVYPNPSKADFNVDFGTLNLGQSLIRVYDAQRKTVFSSETEITLENMASGVYLLEISSKKGRVIKNLVRT